MSKVSKQFLMYMFIIMAVCWGTCMIGSVLGMAFALACVRKCTNSVWLCVLLHCIVNASGAVYMIHDDITGKAVMAGIMIVITLLIVWLIDKKKIYLKFPERVITRRKGNDHNE